MPGLRHGPSDGIEVKDFPDDRNGSLLDSLGKQHPVVFNEPTGNGPVPESATYVFAAESGAKAKELRLGKTGVNLSTTMEWAPPKEAPTGE